VTLKLDLSSEETPLEHLLPQLYRTILSSFRKVSKSFALFNVSFATLFLIELIAFFVFSPLLTEPAILALSLSGLFLTIFSYFIFLFYYQAKKPEQLMQLKEQFAASMQKLAGTSEGELRLCLAASFVKLSSHLDDFESSLYAIPSLLSPAKSWLERLSARCHWHDVFRFQQILLHAAIEELLKQIRTSPTDLEVHATLANTYIALSKLFTEPTMPSLMRMYRKRKETLQENFLAASMLAIEEFQILNHYAPNDPWVHEQLAAGYRALGRPHEEIREVEILLQLRPQDRDLMLRLGTLYFEQGANAKGLKIYEELKRANYQKAQDLLAAYGNPHKSRPLCEIL